MGYSLCIVGIFGHFQNALIFGILGVFWSCFMHRTTLMCLQKGFSYFEAILFFDPKLVFCMGYSLCIVAIFGHFQNALIFRILAVFLEPLFAQTHSNVFEETFFACFRHFYFLTETDYFAWAIAIAQWPFRKCSHFSNISCVLKPFFAQNNSTVFVETFFACFRQFYFF